MARLRSFEVCLDSSKSPPKVQDRIEEVAEDGMKEIDMYALDLLSGQIIFLQGKQNKIELVATPEASWTVTLSLVRPSLN